MPTSIEKTFLKTISEKKLTAAGDHILLAVSGGADSVALLYLFARLKRQLGVKISVAHFNHLLRGRLSDRDEKFVRRLARSLGLSAFFGRSDVAGRAKKLKTSVENAARQMRYEFLIKTAARIKANRIATAHHLDDQAETFFLRLLRGAGRTGHRGIHYQRSDRIIRPLLDVSRARIEKFLRKNKIKYVTDTSNRDQKYTRNRLRRQIMPLLEKINPRLKENIGRTAEIFQEEENWLSGLTAKAVRQMFLKDGNIFRLNLIKFNRQSRPLKRRILKNIMENMTPPEKEISARNLNALLELAAAAAGQQRHLPGPVYAWRYDDLIFFSRQQPVSKDRSFSRQIKIGQKLFIPETAQTVCLSSEKNPGLAAIKKAAPKIIYFEKPVAEEKFVVRSRRPGDRFKPLGQGGNSKKVKDLLIDRHIAAANKHLFPVLTGRRGRLLALVGLAISEDHKVRPESPTVLKLTVS